MPLYLGRRPRQNAPAALSNVHCKRTQVHSRLAAQGRGWILERQGGYPGQSPDLSKPLLWHSRASMKDVRSRDDRVQAMLPVPVGPPKATRLHERAPSSYDGDAPQEQLCPSAGMLATSRKWPGG